MFERRKQENLIFYGTHTLKEKLLHILNLNEIFLGVRVTEGGILFSEEKTNIRKKKVER